MSDAPGAFNLRLAPALATVVLTVLGLWLVGSTASIFLLLFLAIIISLYLGAVRDLLVKRGRVPERIAFFLAIVGTLVAIVGLFTLLVPPVVEQTRELVSVLPDQISRWESSIDRFMSRFPAMREVWRPGEHKVLIAVYDQLSTTAGDVVPKVFSLVHIVIEVFAVLVMSIYLALQPGVYREWLIALFPPVHRDLVRDVLRDLADALRSYIVAQLLAMTILAVFTAIGLYILDVPYWLTFGIFTGMVAVVPFFGSLISTVLPALFVLGGPGGGTRALLVLLLGVLVHVFEGNVVIPRVMSHRLELPPVLTIIAVLLMGSLLGPLGLVLAVPILASAMVIVRRILINRIYEGRGFRKSTRDRMFVMRVPAPDGGVLHSSLPLEDILASRQKIESLFPSVVKTKK
ncbi:MAG: AI-2E family transporter [Gemmatimonadaceae bacterium]